MEIFIVTVVALSAYLLPTIIAGARSHNNGWPIVILNVSLGWTLIGWIACLAWSFSSNSAKGKSN